MSGTILVFGASGNVGRPLVKALLARGEQVKAATRSGAAVEGAPGVAFDFANPAALAASLDGVDRAYLLLPAGHVEALALLLPVVKLLAERRIKVVFQSAIGVNADDNIPYRQVELAIERSGTPFVILRPNWFADNFHSYWKAGVDQGVIAVPAGQGRSSFIDVRDIAASAAAALTRSDFDGQALDLTGPEALGYADAAQLLSEVLGKPVRYEAVSDETFITQAAAAGVPRDYAEFLAAIFHPVREGWTAGVTDAVQRLTGEAPRTLRSYVEDRRQDLAA